MPLDKESSAEPQCEACGETINGEIYANSDYDAVCNDCYDNSCECRHCNDEISEDDATFWRSNPFCDTCADQYLFDCDCCGETIYKCRQAYYYWEESCETYCEGCACEQVAYECIDCGDNVYVNEYVDNEGEDYIYCGERCYSCHDSHGKKIHISDNTSWAYVKKCVFDDAYMKLFDNNKAARWLSDFYGYRLEEFEHQGLLLQKGGIEKDKFGFWEGSISVDSEINAKITRWMERIIGNQNIKCSHKKYGEIRPFAELLQYYCRFEFRDDEGGYTTKFEEYQYNKADLYVSIERHRMLRQDIANNKLKTVVGEDKIKEINFKRAMNKLLKRYETLIIASWDGDTMYRWQSDWQRFLTNSVKIELPVKIGFDPSIMKPLEEFNGHVNACQNRRYVDGLAHSFADMLVNPHLLLLIYDANGETIIGRSLIRTYYVDADARTSDEEIDERPFIAPSRLYLSQYGNVKNDVCARIYDVLEQWATEYYGEHHLICYDISRHDQPYRDYISGDSKIELAERNSHGVLKSNYWYPFFLERPRDDSYFIYYPDEQQSAHYVRMEQPRDDIYHNGYGVAEKTQGYRIVSRRGD